jgi:hypothetical protein
MERKFILFYRVFTFSHNVRNDMDGAGGGKLWDFSALLTFEIVQEFLH